MHIAMVAGEYPPRWGGIGSVVFHLAGHLASFGNTVTIITRKNNGIVPQQSGVDVVEVPWLKLPMAFTRSYAKNALKVMKKIDKINKIDVIHVHLPLASFTRKEFIYMRENIAPEHTGAIFSRL